MFFIFVVGSMQRQPGVEQRVRQNGDFELHPSCDGICHRQWWQSLVWRGFDRFLRPTRDWRVSCLNWWPWYSNCLTWAWTDCCFSALRDYHDELGAFWPAVRGPGHHAILRFGSTMPPKEVDPSLQLAAVDDKANELCSEAKRCQFESDSLALARDVAQLGNMLRAVARSEESVRTERILHLKNQNTIGASICAEFMANNCAVMSGVVKQQLQHVDRVHWSAKILIWDALWFGFKSTTHMTIIIKLVAVIMPTNKFQIFCSGIIFHSNNWTLMTTFRPWPCSFFSAFHQRLWWFGRTWWKLGVWTTRSSMITQTCCSTFSENVARTQYPCSSVHT